MINKNFNRPAAWQAGVAKKALFNSLILISIGVFFSCSSSRYANNETKVIIQDNRWLINEQPVHEGSPAEGLLMNVRMVNAVFEDTGPNSKENIPGFDPDANTSRFIYKIPEYMAHGIRAFTISLQGGLPGYEGAVNSAFNANGSLRKEYLDRTARVIQAADKRGAVIILTCFYQRQHSHDRALEGKEAITNAVGNVAQWITDNGFTNVLLEISNEYAHGGFNNWKDGEWLKSVPGQVELIHHAKAIAPNLLVSTSGMGNGLIAEPIARAADFVMIHFNNTALEHIPERIEEALKYGKPVICNEDDKIGASGAEAARLSVKHGAGWGLMHSEKNQDFPFEFDGAADDPVIYRMISRLTTPGASIEDIPSDQLSILITSPKDGDVIISGSNLPIRAAITGIEDREGVEVHIFAKDKVVGKKAASPWEVVWENVPSGKHYLEAVVLDSNGKQLIRSRLVDVEVKPGETPGTIYPGKKWKESSPENQGVDSQTLNKAITYLRKNSGADGVKELMIIRNGHLIWKGTDIDKVHNVWSLTKSFTSTVLGLLIEDGKAALDTRAMRHVPEMAENFPDISLRHFTTMTSGYSAEGDDPERPEASHGQTATPFLPAKPLYSPGSKFAYWDSSMNQFGLVLTRIAGKSMEQLFKERIADPIGMNNKNWDWKDWGEIDGLLVNGGAGNKGKGIYISASELSRFGHLFLNFGRWKDKQLINKEWVKAATSARVPTSLSIGHPSSSEGPGLYGYNWWVNGIQPGGERKWPDAPSSTYSASGFNNNDLFVIPEWNMVIVRLGLDQKEFPITDRIYNSFLQKVDQSIYQKQVSSEK